MRKSALALLALLCVSSCTKDEGRGADLLNHNARIYTVDEARPWAEAVAIRGDKIIWVGDEDEAISYRGEDTKVMDAGGRFLLPGFIDSHNHIRYGNEPNLVDLSEAGDLLAIQEKIRDFAKAPLTGLA
jgi:hypothetical protein